jgi:hypothetical protein
MDIRVLARSKRKQLETSTRSIVVGGASPVENLIDFHQKIECYN